MNFICQFDFQIKLYDWSYKRKMNWPQSICLSRWIQFTLTWLQQLSWIGTDHLWTLNSFHELNTISIKIWYSIQFAIHKSQFNDVSLDKTIFNAVCFHQYNTKSLAKDHKKYFLCSISLNMTFFLQDFWYFKLWYSKWLLIYF